jgi:hypothetical protein
MSFDLNGVGGRLVLPFGDWERSRDVASTTHLRAAWRGMYGAQDASQSTAQTHVRRPE